MSEMMDLMNTAERKLSDATIRVAQADELMRGVTDASLQVRGRQDHANVIKEHLRNGSMGPLQAATALEAMTSRCPRYENLEGWGIQGIEAIRKLKIELGETRELMAKARSIESTRITHGG